MVKATLHGRYMEGTRGRILAMLRRAARTVDEMAGELELTGNAVRGQLIVLERDELVEQQGTRRTGRGRKPALLYRLTAEAERMFSKAHEALVPYLLEMLGEQDALRNADHLRQIGRRMADGRAVAGGDLATRLEGAAALLREMGGLPEVEKTEEGYSICGYSCPFLPVVRTHPELCKVAEGLLNEVLGSEVRERCERTEEVWCRFDVAYAK